MRVAVVGATGLVGSTIIKVLEERNFPVTELIPVASERSVGKKVRFGGKEWSVVNAETAIQMKPVLAIFSAGGELSLKLAPEFAAVGCRVIDNSSAWRMDPTKKLIVPEVNGNSLSEEDMIIANPNCSTIQMVMVLKPLHDKYKIRRVVVSTYQSVSGSGQNAVNEMMEQRKGSKEHHVYPHQIDMNVIPHIDVFRDNGYTKEEMKMVLETNKILEDDTVKVTATTVRVPVSGGHSESVNIEFHNEFDESHVKQLLTDFPGVIVVDNPSMNGYPMPLDAEGKDEVFVGRIRKDYSTQNAMNCWIVADNLRKGAATNTVQIAKLLHHNGWIS